VGIYFSIENLVGKLAKLLSEIWIFCDAFANAAKSITSPVPV
jgi:hypothetical protein